MKSERAARHGHPGRAACFGGLVLMCNMRNSGNSARERDCGIVESRI